MMMYIIYILSIYIGGSYVEPAIFTKEDSVAYTLPFMEKMNIMETSNATIFDNHEQSVEVLRGFLLAHSTQLKNIKIRNAQNVLDKYIPYIDNYKEKYNVALQQYLEGLIGSRDNIGVVPFLKIR